jgi:hypothetical protein
MVVVVELVGELVSKYIVYLIVVVDDVVVVVVVVVVVAMVDNIVVDLVLFFDNSYPLF